MDARSTAYMFAVLLRAASLLTLSSGLFLAGCTGHNIEQRPRGSAPLVRVLLFDKLQSATLRASQPPAVRPAGALALQTLSLPHSTPITVERTPAGWRIGSAEFGPGELVLQPAAPGTLSVNGQSHRGQYRLVPTGAGRFDVVNDLDVDSYLMGVLPKELLADWPEQAYEAQAITARTYALYESRTASPGLHFDLYSGERSQVYGGFDAETAKSRQAVEATAGVVLAWGESGHERIFKAYFSSCCGGITQSAADAFGDVPLPPLSDQNVGARCAASPRFNWPTLVVSKEELTRRIRQWADARNRSEKGMATLDRIEVGTANPSSRPVRFVLIDQRGARFSVRGEDLRVAVNTGAPQGSRLGSSFFTPVNDATAIRFTDGHGLGHGVGLCQWCAEEQARQGARHEDILVNAYRGATLVRAY